jgi:hypothetical protein
MRDAILDYDLTDLTGIAAQGIAIAEWIYKNLV